MSIVIKVEGLSKQYRLGSVGTGSLVHDLNRTWHKVRGKDDPYLMVGETNGHAQKVISKYVWALKDINFDINQGEVVGIIGRNGAGKSTLLKILSRTTAPTTGSVKIKGRVASLLEVGTGFHPELSGRENIFLNGAILGMSKREIKNKFDEIVDFAGVERYIDTPVKRYSSGMYVRLAFGVAAHLEPEILIVDEVLAVGDAEFQKKALGKMKNVSREDGRTVLFVSHNMAALKNICNKGLLLENGKMVAQDKIGPLVEKYLNNVNQEDLILNEKAFIGEGCKIENTRISFNNTVLTNGEDLTVETRFESTVEKPYSIIFALNRNEQCVFASASFYKEDTLNLGVYDITLHIPKHLLNPGHHSIDIMVVDETGNFKSYLHAVSVLSFTVSDDMVRRGNKFNNGWEGAISPILTIEWNKL